MDLDREWQTRQNTSAGQMELFRVRAGLLGEAILAAAPVWTHPGLRLAARLLWG